MTDTPAPWLDAALMTHADCGPDLDATGDDDHLSFLARVEGVLPSSFAEFERSQINFAAELKAAQGLLARSRDLRVLVLVAKLMILDRRLGDFAAVVAAMAQLLETRWEAVHPADDIELRRGILMALDDMPHIVMPLQAVPLFESRALGRVSYRQLLIANGAVQPRENETALAADALAAALERAEESDLVASHDALKTLDENLAAMAAVFSRHQGAGHDLALPKLRALVGEQLRWLGKERTRRNPGAASALAPASAEATPDAPVSGPVPEIVCHREAKAALDAIAGYFTRFEPSSPGLLLVRQARQLADVSFIAALRTLMPDAFGAASIRIGKGSGFNLPMEQLSLFEEPVGEEGFAGDSVAQDEAGEVDFDTPHDNDSYDEFSEEAEDVPHVPERTAAPAPMLRITSQRDAIDLMARVAGFYRSKEPSSPLPLLLDHARGLAGRDFLAVLEEILPAALLRKPDET